MSIVVAYKTRAGERAVRVLDDKIQFAMFVDGLTGQFDEMAVYAKNVERGVIEPCSTIVNRSFALVGPNDIPTFHRKPHDESLPLVIAVKRQS